MIGAVLNLYIGLAFVILEGFVNYVHRISNSELIQPCFVHTLDHISYFWTFMYTLKIKVPKRSL